MKPEIKFYDGPQDQVIVSITIGTKTSYSRVENPRGKQALREAKKLLSIDDLRLAKEHDR